MAHPHRRAMLTLALGLTFGPMSAQANLPPDCSLAVPSVVELWPPNHKLVAVAVDGVLDPDGDPVTLVVTGVTQDEPVDDAGGATCPDAVGVGTDVVGLRSERQGSGDGRVYHVAFSAQDPFGAACTGSVTACVLHDQRPGGVCGDGGPLFDSTVGDPVACGGGPVCDIDACIPSGDDFGECGLALPPSVLRKRVRARTLLSHAAVSTKPARRARLGRRVVRLLGRAEARARRIMEPSCGAYVGTVLSSAADCVACATDRP